jgi:RecJ-like exonuclease
VAGGPCKGRRKPGYFLEKGDLTMDFEAYCVKCREKRTIKNGNVKQTANGRQMAQGTCPVCGTTVTRFLSAEKTK